MTLTREAIEAANGRELDALVAEHICGWTRAKKCRIAFALPNWVNPRGQDQYEWQNHVLPQYSISGDAMLLVLEKMREKGWNCELSSRVKSGPSAIFHTEDWDETDEGIGHFRGDGSLPEQVCKSALLAIVSQEERK